jgi:hypothetical protein
MNELLLLLAAAFMVICGIYAGHEGLALKRINRTLAKVVKDLESGVALAPAWQPIASAPKDRTDVLVWLDGNRGEQLNGRAMVCRYDGYSGWCIPGVGGLNATHWMPSPERPK